MGKDRTEITYADVVLHLQSAARSAKNQSFSLTAANADTGEENVILSGPKATPANSAVLVLDPSGSHSDGLASAGDPRPFYYVKTIGELANVGSFLIGNADSWVEEIDSEDYLYAL